MTATGRVQWSVLTDIEDALSLVDRAAADAGFRTERGTAAEIRVEVPRSLLRRRKAIRLSGSAFASTRGTEIFWTTDGPDTGRFEHLLTIEEQIPEGALYYHGLLDAAGRAGLSLGGKREIRTIVSALGRNETVRAVGQGRLDDKPGFIILTDARLLVIENSPVGTEPLLDADHSSIQGISLGKKTAGETLRIVSPAGEHEISGLGHGEGHGIATSFRSAMAERARTPRPQDR